jgi:hypothetical protein
MLDDLGTMVLDLLGTRRLLIYSVLFAGFLVYFVTKRIAAYLRHRRRTQP